MRKTEKDKDTTRNYYVDESGDGVLFDKKGKVIFGTPGCMNFFILGHVYAEDPIELQNAFTSLRSTILLDPYFKKIPSMIPNANKTALFFHAKDDIPEVRREVYRILKEQEIHFCAIVKRMAQVLKYVHSRNMTQKSYCYHPNELYDFTVRMLFKDKLHKLDHYNIFFARRGKTTRTKALENALIVARDRFLEEIRAQSDSEICVIPRHAHEEAGLQAVDYLLWALQRFYEKHEERYIEYIWQKISVIHDVDDTRVGRYGCYYTQKKPLTLAAIKEAESIG